MSQSPNDNISQSKESPTKEEPTLCELGRSTFSNKTKKMETFISVESQNQEYSSWFCWISSLLRLSTEWFSYFFILCLICHSLLFQQKKVLVKLLLQNNLSIFFVLGFYWKFFVQEKLLSKFNISLDWMKIFKQLIIVKGIIINKRNKHFLCYFQLVFKTYFFKSNFFILTFFCNSRKNKIMISFLFHSSFYGTSKRKKYLKNNKQWIFSKKK